MKPSSKAASVPGKFMKIRLLKDVCHQQIQRKLASDRCLSLAKFSNIDYCTGTVSVKPVSVSIVLSLTLTVLQAAGEATLPSSFRIPSQGGQLSEVQILSLQSKALSGKMFSFREANMKSQKLFPL